MSHRDIFGTFPAPTPPKNDPTRLNYRLGLRYEMIQSQAISAEDKYKARMAAREQFTLDPKDVSTDQRSGKRERVGVGFDMALWLRTRTKNPKILGHGLIRSLVGSHRSYLRLLRAARSALLALHCSFVCSALLAALIHSLAHLFTE